MTDDFGEGGGAYHLAPLPRRFDRPLPVAMVGWLPAYAAGFRHRFTMCAFSFIFYGDGVADLGDGDWQRVAAPALLAQWPRQVVRHGPNSAWDMLYIAYHERFEAQLRRIGYLDGRQRVWSMASPALVADAVHGLADLLRGADQPGMADRIDHQCELLLLLARGGSTGPRSDLDEAVAASIARLELDPLRPWSAQALARDAGVSVSTLRRAWRAAVGEPPERYRLRALMRRACRLLVETDRGVGDIAEELGFGDPAYFSRRFRGLIGVAAKDYRGIHRRLG